MTDKDLLAAIGQTSGGAGMEAYASFVSRGDLAGFISWYKKDISFNTKKSRELGQRVIAALSK